MEFKDMIKKRRTDLNMTMDELALKVGVSTPTIQRYESGEIKNVRRDKIKLLSDALQCSPGYLMGWNNTVDNISYDETPDNTPFNRALEKINKNISLSKEENEALKNELLIILKKIPGIFETFTFNINDAFEKKLLLNFRYLNSDGKVEALKRLEELAYIPKYTESSEIELNAAHVIPGSSDEERRHDDELMDNDDNWV